MKKIINGKLIYGLIIGGLMLSLAFSCSKDSGPDEKERELEHIAQQMQGDAEVIAAMGYNTDGIKEMGAFYVVEGDVLIRKENIALYAESLRNFESDGQDGPQTKAAYFYPGNILKEGNRNVTVKCLHEPYKEIVKRAIQAWNSCIKERPVSFYAEDSWADADITIRKK